jgi:hypothetical protein
LSTKRERERERGERKRGKKVFFGRGFFSFLFRPTGSGADPLGGRMEVVVGGGDGPSLL